MNTIAASEFKAKCLAILDDVKATGQRVVISKRGQPIAELSPYIDLEKGPAQETLRGSGRIAGDIESIVVPVSEWRSAVGS